MVQRSLPALHADSEGGAALLGTSPAAALTTLIQLPYWRDCLTGGGLAEARGVLPEVEDEYLVDVPDLPVRRGRLLDALGLVPDDGLMLPAEAAAVPGYVPLTADGRPYRWPTST